MDTKKMKAEIEARLRVAEQAIKRLDQRVRTLRHEALNPQYREKVIMTKRDTYRLRRERGQCVKCGEKALQKKDGGFYVHCKKHKGRENESKKNKGKV